MSQFVLFSVSSEPPYFGYKFITLLSPTLNFLFVGVEPSPLIPGPFVVLLYQSWMIDDGDDCGEISGMNEGQVSRSTWRELPPAPLYPPQILP
jgi:hypothetical protein